jgi:sporulation protein YlmC with PRC-barrel domain
VADFYFDDQSRAIVYLIVKTGNWLSGRKVLLSTYAVIKGAARSGTIPVNITREQIRTSPDIDTDKPVYRQQEDKGGEGDLHLRCTQAILGYHIETTDGELGHLRDFIIDDETWRIEYLVVGLHHWPEGKKVLVACEHIKDIQCNTSRIFLNMTSFVLENSMAYYKPEPFSPEVDIDVDHNFYVE